MKEVTDSLYRQLILTSTMKTIDNLKQLVVQKFGIPETSEVELVLLPDTLIMDDNDVQSLVDGSQLQVFFAKSPKPSTT